ncbi:MAG: hypothetical protein ABIR98_02225 [Usitatibacter sp.]
MATHRLPTDEKIVFLISDDVRQEMGSKLTLLGFIPGNLIFIDPDTISAAQREKKKVAFPLVIVFVALDGEGTFLGRAGLVDPGGTEIWGDEPTPITLTPGISRTFVLKVLALQAIDGEYTARLRLGDRDYVRHFKLVIGHPPRVEQ